MCKSCDVALFLCCSFLYISYWGVAFDWFNNSDYRYLCNTWVIAACIHRLFSAVELFIDNRGMGIKDGGKYEYQNGILIILLQLLDVEIFRDVYASIISYDKHPHEKDRMYWIRTMEAVFVSFCLTVCTFVYLFDNQPTNPENFFVFVTLFVALASTTFALVHYTQSETLTFGHFSKKNKAITEAIEAVFRLCEVLGRSLLFALIWFVIYIHPLCFFCVCGVVRFILLFFFLY